MNLKERFLLYWKDHKKELFGWILGLITFLFAGLAGGVALEETNPKTFTLRGARVTEVARVTPTPAQGRLTPSPTKPALTSTPTVGKPSETPAPTGTNTPGATNTPLPFPTVTPTSIIVGHDVTECHKPGIAGHHHGLCWQDAPAPLLAWMNSNPLGGLFKTIGSLWPSSPIENIFPFPGGKHDGFTNLSEANTHCNQFKLADLGLNCIMAYYFQPHVQGNAGEVRTPVHSWKGLFWVCDYETQTQCDVVAMGGWVNFGEHHSQYKKTFCPQENRVQYPSQYTTDQPPYVAVAGSDRKTAFWSSITNPVIEKYFNPIPNQLMETAWNNRPFSMPASGDVNNNGIYDPGENPEVCADPSLDLHFDDVNSRNNVFQVFFFRLFIAQYPRPYEGFTDRYGNEAKNCTAVSLDCIPLYIGPNTPQGDALLNRDVTHGDPEAAPIQVFGDANTPLNPPGTISNP